MPYLKVQVSSAHLKSLDAFAALPSLFETASEAAARRQRKYRLQNKPMTEAQKESKIAYARNYYSNNRNYFKLYYEKHRRRMISSSNYCNAKKIIELRLRIFKELGQACVICGFSDYRALQIDHVNGEGCKDRKNRNTRKYLLHVLFEITHGSKEYQLLCANCNWIKRYSMENHIMRIALANEFENIARKIGYDFLSVIEPIEGKP